MNPEDHKERHKELHKALKQLATDFTWQTDKMVDGVTVRELLQWSRKQAENPTEKEASSNYTF